MFQWSFLNLDHCHHNVQTPLAVLDISSDTCFYKIGFLYLDHVTALGIDILVLRGLNLSTIDLNNPIDF